MAGLLETMDVTGRSIIILRNEIKNSTIASDLSNRPSRFPSTVVNSVPGNYPFKKRFFDSVVYLGAPSPDMDDLPNCDELRALVKNRAKFFLVK